MIIYGWKSSHLESRPSPHSECPSCQTKGSIVNSVFGKYFHIFWIPLFPLGKTGVASCQHCKYTMEGKEMTEDIKNDYREAKSLSRTPIWQFSGLAIIAVIAVIVTISGNKEKENELAFLDNPQANDVYRYKTDDNNYSTLMVIEVLPDSLHIAPNNYYFTKRRGIEAIEADSSYADYYYSYTREEIKEMYEEGTIYDVIREVE